MPILRKIRTFSGLPGDEVWAFFEATVLLTYARIIVNLVPLSYWRKQVQVSKHDTADMALLTKEQRQKSRMVMRTINRAGRNLPVKFVCLPQAFAARWMLTRRGIPTELFLGTQLAAEEDREFHAWLKAGDIMITGHCDEEAYAVFGSQRRA
ncbi:lasso peptide biosynthesis B2 protein [Pontixanthobacter aestiaquae]|uniref:Lasso peptide biosynthesis B2 protein n=1 Tax=Pontixanthobacter aestiaquae TaxID=1509367 RepID=A0A844ZAE2_9SPHN|nr:lasso peptide biosynthesis B2 protein [Pontixanthobacter aestiaquae]MDN3644831.1 lasso peptide biosynthesis B2 protein [Pontixanthobacter aestiaquae]MXO84166.1 lasso peptide biosynthesis B2 protein [Pontixanthobacter aestiaquae]